MARPYARRCAPLALVCCLIAAIGAGCDQGEETLRPVAVVNGRLFDGTDGAVSADGVVVIEGSKISAAGPGPEVPIPEDARIIDAGGGFIMPGVIDAHVHIESALEEEPELLTRWLESGVTGVAALASRWPAGVRRLAAAATTRHPRLYIASPILTAPGGYPSISAPSVNAMSVHSADEAALVTRHLVDEHGVDVVKIAIETGFLSGYEEPGWPTLAPATVEAIAAAAHARSKKVHAHVTQASEMAVAIEGGCDVAAHTPIDDVPDDVLQRGVARGFILTSTANIWADEEHLVAARGNLRRYTAMGGRVALGTDAPGYQPGGEMPLGELRQLERAGLAASDVLLAATRNAAAAVGADDSVGTLEPGKLADLIIVAGDPLSDIEELSLVVCVIADGLVVGGCDSGSPPAGR